MLWPVIVAHQMDPAGDLTELEYIQGEAYANVWETTFITRIAAHTGWIDIRGINPDPAILKNSLALNGIT